MGNHSVSRLLQWNMAAVLVSLALTTSAIAQVDQIELMPVDATEQSQHLRKFKLISDAQTQNYLPKFASGGTLTDSVMFETNGKIGVGTTVPFERFHVWGGIAIENPNATSFVAFRLNPNGGIHGGGLFASGTSYPDTSSANAAGTIALMSYETGGVSLTSGSTTNGSVRMYTAGSGPGNERLRITHAGDVGIGTAAPTAKLHVNGNIIATGSITGATVLGAVYQDVAEWVPASTDMPPGTVVVLNLEKNNEVMPSGRSYDTTVAGVVSAAPGIILGVSGTSKEQIATTGRVKVRVDARSAAVRIGDLLVTSDTPGAAMRSAPMDLQGRQFHQPGTIIGKALEPLDGGIGEILVLLSMQ